MKCCDVQTLLAVRRELSSAEEQNVQVHLEGCQACRAFWAHVTHTQEALHLLTLSAAVPSPGAVLSTAQRLRQSERYSETRQLRPVSPIVAAFSAVIAALVLLAFIPWLLLRFNAPAGATGSHLTGALSQAVTQTFPAVITATTQPLLLTPATILVLGSDARPNQTQAAFQTDSAVVLRLDPSAGKITALSLPRDLWLTYPNQEQGRLNAAYVQGEQINGQQSGGQFVKDAVSATLGFPIDYVLLVRFDQFTQLIDQLGGITVNVPQPIDDPMYPTDEYGVMSLHFDAGTQHLDGAKALMYVRTRHGDSDFNRIRRQQQVILAMYNRLHEQDLLQHSINFANYIAVVRDAVDTDIPASRLLSIARWVQTLDLGAVELLSVDETMVQPLEAPATFTLNPIGKRMVMNLLK